MGWVEKKTLDGLVYYVNAETNEIAWDKPQALSRKSEVERNKELLTWAPSEDMVWEPARVTSQASKDGTSTVQTLRGKTLTVPKDRMMWGPDNKKIKMEFWDLKQSDLTMLEDDIVMLPDTNEAIILHQLRERYMQDKLYTWVGASRTVLISVNPYKKLPIYDWDHIQLHRNRSPNRELPAHVFDIANDSYDSMLFENQNQSVLISGESGAGKTEATKQCLKFIASVAGSDDSVETKILEANPLLEAFGNAKTVRNNNSSRFGKWIEVFFAQKQGRRSITGAKITNYLLEKSRLIQQSKGERNFHIFYQLAADSQANGTFNIGSLEDHALVNGGLLQESGVDDVGDFQATRQAFSALGFSEEEKEWAFSLVAFCLHVGDVKFSDQAQKNNVRGSITSSNSQQSLELASSLLGVNANDLKQVLLFRSIQVRTEKNVIPLDPEAAKAGLASLIKGIYGRLFDWLVLRVNQSLQGREGSFVGILDIFGFEIFQLNSFEQLCINFANEKLQQLFNKTTFKEEEDLYRKEGIQFQHVEFIDNQPVLDLLESKPNGVLLSLDDSCLIPEGNDTKFIHNLVKTHSRNAKFGYDEKHKNKGLSELCFCVNHYAGQVQYDASFFHEKNRDLFYADAYQVCSSSSIALTKALFPQVNNKQQQQIKSLGGIFRNNLNLLMDKLNSTSTRYIRCVKPNSTMSAHKFEAQMSLEQLIYSGVFEAVEIRKKGYPFRYPYARFALRFRCINPNHKYKNTTRDLRALCQEILQVSPQDFDDVQFGKTMVLYRAKEHRLLKLLRNLALETLVPKMQKHIRGLLPREMKRRCFGIEKEINEALKTQDYTRLKVALETCNGAIGNGLLKLFPGVVPRNLNIGRARLQNLEAESELKLAQQRGDQNAIIYWQIRVVQTDLDQNGAQYDISRFPNLKTPTEYASGRMFGKAKAAENYLRAEKGGIASTLTRLSNPASKKQALSLNKLLISYVEKGNDKSGAKFVSAASAAALSDAELQCELFLQAMKQVNGNPDDTKRQRALNLLLLTCRFVAIPSSTEKFVMQFCKKNTGGNHGKGFISAMNEQRYGKVSPDELPNTAQDLHQILSNVWQLEKTGSRFSTRR